jgi:acyl carrier protein
VWPLSRKPRGTAPPEPAAVDASPRDDGEALRSIEGTIRQFLAAYMPEGRRRARRMAATASLWNEVNSLTMLQLVSFIETKFAIQVRPIDFAPQNFSSVAAIARFVATRRPPAAAP